MTCFWDSIYQSLNHSHFQQLEYNRNNNLKAFINHLKNKKTKLSNVTWQNNPLTQKEIDEHLEAIQEYNVNNIHNGHFTSTCDYFLLLLCELLEIGIDHVYLGHTIEYRNKKNNTTILKFGSDKGHFFKL